MPTKCETCGSSFQSNDELLKHMEKEHGKESLVCEECGPSFRSEEEMK